MKMWIFRQLGWAFVLFWLAACNVQVTSNAPLATPTLSITPTLLPTQDFTETPVAPTLSPTPESTASTTPKPKSETMAREATIIFFNETIPDGTQQEPGQEFTKTWTIRNGGPGVWTDAYDLFLISSNPTNERLGAPESLSLAHEVKPGEEITISVHLVAPARMVCTLLNTDCEMSVERWYLLVNSGSRFEWVKCL